MRVCFWRGPAIFSFDVNSCIIPNTRRNNNNNSNNNFEIRRVPENIIRCQVECVFNMGPYILWTNIF